MCQLFGMSSNKPISLQFSLSSFMQRGGATSNHIDGWGLARYQNDECHLIVEDLPAASSDLASQIIKEPVKARTVIAHVRKATQGNIKPENCHPFVRNLWGTQWSFAHNGDLKSFQHCNDLFVPYGDTDSEHAFCFILYELEKAFGDRMPSISTLQSALQRIFDTIHQYGTFNLLLSNGDLLFAYGSTQLWYLSREAPFSTVHYADHDLTIDLAGLNHLDDLVTVIATEPLTVNEPWGKISAGTLLTFKRGRRYNNASPIIFL